MPLIYLKGADAARNSAESEYLNRRYKSQDNNNYTVYTVPLLAQTCGTLRTHKSVLKYATLTKQTYYMPLIYSNGAGAERNREESDYLIRRYKSQDTNNYTVYTVPLIAQAGGTLNLF